MFHILSDAKSFCSKFIDGGTCDEDVQTDVINEAIQHLLIAADWKLTVRKASVHICNGWFTAPREWEKVIGHTSNHIPGIVQTKYWEFLEGGPGRIDNAACTLAEDLVDQGNFPTFADIKPDKQRYLIAYSTDKSDTDLSLTINGLTEYNREVVTNGVPGITLPINYWKDGVEGQTELIDSKQRSTPTFNRIIKVIKPQTKGYITLYAYDPDYDLDEGDAILSQLAVYHPDELQPSYRRYKLMNQRECGTLLTVLAKVAYVPAKRDTDELLIQNLPAIKFMVQAINKYNNEDINAGDALKARALTQLNMQSKDYEHLTNDITVASSYRNSEVPNLI